MPRRNVFVDKKIRYVKINDKYKSCFFILTQIGRDRVEVERTIEEFMQLYTVMKEIFTQENFPKHPLPKFQGFYSEGDVTNPTQNFLLNDNKSEYIEKWLD